MIFNLFCDWGIFKGSFLTLETFSRGAFQGAPLRGAKSRIYRSLPYDTVFFSSFLLFFSSLLLFFFSNFFLLYLFLKGSFRRTIQIWLFVVVISKTLSKISLSFNIIKRHVAFLHPCPYFQPSSSQHKHLSYQWGSTC